MGTAPAWVTVKRAHAMDSFKRVMIDGETLVPTLCGVLKNDDEMRRGNVAFFAIMSTVGVRVECEGCKDEARVRDSSGVGHRDFHSVGDADRLSETA